MRKLTSAERTSRDTRLSQADKDLLASRLCNDEMPPPKEAVYIFGDKDKCKVMNKERLQSLEGDLVVINAHHSSDYFKNYKPKADKHGYVHNTAFVETLELKIGAKVMLRHNVATKDGLINGAIGYVVGFEYQGEGNNTVKTIFVEFEDERVGKEARENSMPLLMRHGFPKATPITKVSFEYSVGKKKKDHAAKAKVIQFPLNLAWAINAHKCQGITIKAPHCLVLDMDSLFGDAMGYVCLSRIQNISCRTSSSSGATVGKHGSTHLFRSFV